MSLHHHHHWSSIIFSSIAFSALDRAPSYSFCSETCESLTASLCQSGPRGTSNGAGEDHDSIRPEVESRYLAGLGSRGLFVANETACQSWAQRALSTIASKWKTFSTVWWKIHVHIQLSHSDRSGGICGAGKKTASGSVVFSWSHHCDINTIAGENVQRLYYTRRNQVMWGFI